MKEPDYTMMLMPTYGTLTMMGVGKRHYMENGVKIVLMFLYLKVVYKLYAYCDVLNNHNAGRMYPISTNETWMTEQWPN